MSAPLAPVPATLEGLVRPGDVALVIVPDTATAEVPFAAAFSHIVRLTAEEDDKDFCLQRTWPPDEAFWAQMDRRLQATLAEGAAHLGPGGSFHLYLRSSHAVALRLGQLLFQRYEGVPLTIYHFDRRSGMWELFAPPTSRFTLPPAVPFFTLEHRPPLPGHGTLLSIETPQVLEGARVNMLTDSAARVGVRHVIRAMPPKDQPFIGDLPQRLGALQELLEVLSEIERLPDGPPLHILTSAPVALMVQLASRVRRTVVPQMIFHHHDTTPAGASSHQTAGYRPLLDVVSGKIIPPARYPWDGPPRLFISYSREDERFRAELDRHLATLKREGMVESWHDRLIKPGERWEEVLDEAIERSSFFVALVSPAFLASEYCYSREFGRALQRCEERRMQVIPVICRPCDWKSSPLGSLQALPRDVRPIAKWSSRDEAWLDVIGGLRRVVGDHWKARHLGEA